MNSQSYSCTWIKFTEVLTVYAGDTIELDWKRKKAMVVSSAGKVRTSTEFVPTEADNGASITTGPRQD